MTSQLREWTTSQHVNEACRLIETVRSGVTKDDPRAMSLALTLADLHLKLAAIKKPVPPVLI